MVEKNIKPSFDPLTSVPMKGTKIKVIKKIKKNIYESTNSLFFFLKLKKKHCKYTNCYKNAVLKKEKNNYWYLIYLKPQVKWIIKKTIILK